MVSIIYQEVKIVLSVLSEWLEEYKDVLFAVYWLRWLFSAMVMMPFMIFFQYLGLSLFWNLLLGQTIGSVIFFKIDKFIFNT